VTSKRADEGTGLYIVTQYECQVAKTESLSGFQLLFKRSAGMKDAYKEK